MQAVIGALRANLGLDSAQFERGAKRGQSAAQKLQKDLSRMATVAAAAGAAIIAMAQRGATEIDRLAKAGRRIDTTVGGMRALELAASEAGVSVGSLTDAVQNLDREVASGSRGAAAALERLGLAASDLQGLEADQKLAVIADRVKEMGLSTGEATALLREFGIRNRDMILLLMQGGDALRNARSDVQEYGLALSRVDAAAIERANDQIGRLRLVGQFLQQEFARNLIPSFGMLAEAITNSLREGGRLRAVLETIASNIRTVVTVLGTAVAAFGAYRAILIATSAAKTLLAAASNGLRTALLRLGLPALIVAAGLLIDQFLRLIERTGGWAEALKLLGDVASGVWEGIKTSAASIVPAVGAVWASIKASFQGMIAEMAWMWAGFLRSMSDSLDGVMGMGAIQSSFDRATNAVQGFGNRASQSMAQAKDQAIALRNEASSLATEGFDKAKEALAQLNKTIQNNETNTDGATDAVKRLNEAMIELAGGGGGGAGGSAASGGIIEQAKNSFEQLGQSIQSSMEQGFMSILDGTKRAKDAFKDMARQIISELLRVLVVQRIVGSFGGGGILGSLGKAFGIGANANGTTNWQGGMTLVGERGPELVNLPRGSQVVDAQRTASRMGGDEIVQHFNFNLSANGDESVRRIVAQAAPQIVEAAKSGVLDARRRGGQFRAAFG
jgi:hypothetical protein